MEQGRKQGMECEGAEGGRKRWLSYPLWVLYTLLVGSCIAAGIWRPAGQAGKSGGYLAAAAAAAGLLAAVGIWFAGRLIIRFYKNKSMEKKNGKKVSPKRKAGNGLLSGRLEYPAVIVLCGAAFCLRLCLFFSMDGAWSDGVSGNGGGAFYEAALVKEGGGVPWNAHGASYFYTVLLSFVLSFSGNKVTAGIALQMVLQVVGLPFFYAAVKRLTGRGEAFCALAALAFTPGYYAGMFSLTPEPLFGLFFSLGLFWCGQYVRGTQKGTAGGKAYLFPAFCGLYTGFAGWLDPAGWLLFLPVLFFSLRTLKKDAVSEGEGTAEGRKRAVLRTACYLVSSLLSFLALLWVCGAMARTAGQTYAGTFSAWYRAAFGGLSVPSAAGIWSYLTEQAFMPLVCLCAAFAVAGFWGGKGQKQDVWVTLLLLLFVFPVFGIGGMEYGMLRTMIWGILAGIGICSMGTGESAGTAPVPDRTESASDRVSSAPDRAEAVSDEPKGDSAEDKPKVKLIENPLPLPKKHVKREMTYAKEVEGAEMEFDISVAEDDDFDI